MTLWNREPAALIGLLQAVFTVAATFGWFDLTREQAGAIIAVFVALSAIVARQQVTPVADPRI
jgi:hypothetical protein